MPNQSNNANSNAGQVVTDFNQVIRNYKVGQILSREQLQSAATKFLFKKNPSDDEKKLISAYEQGDYRHLDEVAYKGVTLKKREILSMKYFDDRMAEEFHEVWYGAETYADAVNRVLALPDGADRMRRIIDQNALHPLFRLGLSCIAHMGKGTSNTNEQRGYHFLFSEEVRITTKIVEDTLEPLTQERREEIRFESTMNRETTDRLLEQNDEQQLAMAKHFLMMQLGGIRQREQAQGEQYVSSATMAEIIAHGGRLVVTLPTGDAQLQDHMMDSVMGENRGNAAGVIKRSAATHNVMPKEVNADGTVIKTSRETNPKTGSWSNNYGMNFAGGGMGKEAQGTMKTNYNDGQSGHCYIKVAPGDQTRCGQMLIGFETSEPGKTTHYGLAHDWHARSAPQSSFLADKVTPGIKIDGREVDLSNLSPETFATVMNRFEQRYRELLMRGDIEKMKSINKMLTGRMINTSELTQFLSGELGFSPESADMIATQSRFALISPDKNLANDAKVRPLPAELAVNPAMNRVCAEERMEPEDPAARSIKALASKAKRDEMARQLKDLRASKIGLNSGTYKKLLTAAETLKRDMDTLAEGRLKPIERSQLISRIEKETKELKEQAGEYVRVRGKGNPHPGFRSEWGEKRFYSARSLMYLTEKMQNDLELTRDLTRSQGLRGQEIGASRNGDGGHARETAQVKDTNITEIEEKVGVHTGENREDFSRKRQELEQSKPGLKLGSVNGESLGKDRTDRVMDNNRAIVPGGS